jgi:PAS domain S-box-containing protein
LAPSDPDGQVDGFNSLHRVFVAAITSGLPGKLEGFYLKLKENDGLPKDGIYCDVEVIPVLNESDLPESIIVSFKETEKRTLSTNPDSENSQYYQSIIENSLNAFFLTRPDGTLLEANKAAYDMFGYSLEELRQVGREGIIDHREGHIHEKIRERSETGKLKAGLVGIKKSGEKFPMEVSSVLFFDVNGEKRSSSTISDISQRKQVEKELLISEEKYKTLFEDNPLPILI